MPVNVSNQNTNQVPQIILPVLKINNESKINGEKMSLTPKVKEERRLPNYIGLVDIKWVPDYPLHKLLDFDGGLKQTNSGRNIDVDPSVIAQWATLHKNGLYNDYLYDAPLVNPYELEDDLVYGYCNIRGIIQYVARPITEQDTIGVWTGRWVDDIDEDGVMRPSTHWIEVARSNENINVTERKDFIQTPRTELDISGSLLNLYQNRKTFKLIDEHGKKIHTDLNRVLKSLKVTSSQTSEVKRLFFQKVDPSMAVDEGGLEGTSTDDQQARQKIIMKFTQENPDAIIIQKTVETSLTVKYSTELISELLNAYSKHPNKKIIGVLTFSRVVCDDKGVLKARINWKNFLMDDKKQFRKLLRLFSVLLPVGVNFLLAPFLKNVKICFYPQLHGEKKEFYKTGEMF